MTSGINSRAPARTDSGRAWLVCLGLAVLAGATLAAAAAESPAGADPGAAALDKILAALAQQQHGHVLFHEEVVSALLKRPLHASGELFFTAPDRLEKRTLQPAAEDLVVEGDVLTISRGAHRSSLRLSQYPQLSPLLNGIRATLAGDLGMLASTFQVRLEQSGDQWSLTLRPLVAEPAPVYERIRIEGSAGVVHSVAMERHNGDRTLMTLSEPAEP